MEQLLDNFRDLPGFLDGFIADYGPWIYALLFAIIFVETGLVIMPFLPGDSLLFAAGAIAARGSMSLWLLLVLLTVAAVAGDALNYAIGHWIGPRVFRKQLAPGERATWIERALNRKHLEHAHEFFERYGGKAVILGRFVPIARTFIPFVAGAGAMSYPKFALYNVIGAIAWVGLCTIAGWWFGGIPWVEHNFEAVIVAIIVISVIPLGVEALRERAKRRRASKIAPVGEGHSAPVQN